MTWRFIQLRNDLLVCIGIVALLALTDNILGGVISTIVFWSQNYCDYVPAQTVNDAYQVMFFLYILSTLSWLALKWQEPYRVSAIAIMLFGYLEDVFYYLWFYITADFIQSLIGGIEIEVGLPNRVSGWVGFVSRYTGFTFGGWPTWLIIVNLISVFSLSGWILWKRSNLIRK